MLWIATRQRGLHACHFTVKYLDCQNKLRRDVMAMSTTARGSQAQLVGALMSAGRRISRASLLFRDAVAAAAGLHVTDAECIDFLLEAGEATAGQLASAAGLTPGAMTTAIDRLERAGFVERVRDAEDRRRVIVRPVMARIRPFVPLYESMGRNVRKLYGRYTLQELRVLLSHQEGLAAIYEEEAAKVRNSVARRDESRSRRSTHR
jgi:MarR family transcriptional regulator, organic hydroperoxide resistance regulator